MNKKGLVIGLVTGLTIGVSGAAIAYFTAAGNGTGQSAVGATGTWTVAQNGSASGSMYPGAGSSAVTFTITNAGNGYQAIESGKLTATIVSDGSGNVKQNGVAVTGCLASWFTPVVGTPTPGYGSSVAPTTGSYSDTVTVTMSDSGTNQDACESVTPDVNLAVAA